MEAEKILVVDDNKEIVYSISELLKYEGYETLKAYDGMEALDIMERENVPRRKKVIRCRDLRSEQMTILRSRIILQS